MEAQPERQSAFMLACIDDTELVARFARQTRKVMGDAMLHGAAFNPLVSLVVLSAQGLLPQAAWQERLANVPRGTDQSNLPRAVRKERWSTLLHTIRHRIPRGAHSTRLRQALHRLPKPPRALRQLRAPNNAGRTE